MRTQSKNFLVTNKNDNGDGRGQSSWFSNGHLEMEFDKGWPKW